MLAAAAAIPGDVGLAGELVIVEQACARGYFLPDEDDRIRAVFVSVLTTRAALLDCLASLERGAGGGAPWAGSHDAFLVAFAATCLLWRGTRFLIELADGRPLLWKKLDEPEPRHGIGYKSFSHLYRESASPRRLARFRAAVDHYRARAAETAARAGDPLLGPVVELLEKEERWLPRKRDLVRRALAHGWFAFLRSHHSGYRRTMFHLFRLGGMAVSDLRQPGIKPAGAPKRIGPRERAELMELARPGDVFLTRHDDALSNWFLPGRWPHAALHLGGERARAAIGLGVPAAVAERAADPVRFVEAKKDGVRFRPAEDTLAVDECVVLRPGLPDESVAEALARAMSHEGKLYDFLFDFRKSDRLACTELVYRGYHGVGGVEFRLIEVSNRWCLPAEELAAQAVAGGFRVVAICGYRGEGVIRDGQASDLFQESLIATNR